MSGVQRSFAQIPHRKANTVDLDDVFRFVAQPIRDAAIRTANQLKHLGIRHCLVGGLAVGAHGYLRATKDVDFLVGDEAFEHHGTLITFKSGVPIEVAGIKIDYLSPAALGKHLDEAFSQSTVSAGLPVIPIEALVFMKLIARRRQDLLDVVELLKVGIDDRKVTRYLEQFAPELLPAYAELRDEASA